MKKIFAVARWEFVEKVKTKAFLISLIVTPVILILFMLGGPLLSNKETDYTKTIGLIDTSGIYFSPIKEKLGEYLIADHLPNYLLINLTKKNQNILSMKAAADSLVMREVMNGYLIISNAGSDSVKAEFRNKSITNFKDKGRLEKAFNEITINLTLKKAGVDQEVLNKISQANEITQIQISNNDKKTKPDFVTTFFSSIIFIMMLLTLVLSSGGMLVRSLIEEKSNKLIDIIVSSCTADELLTGKILGLGLLGFVQVFIWAIIGIILTSSALVSPEIFNNIFLILIYFILGFIFYTSMFVGIGSLVSTEQEAQQITGYLILLLLLPIVLAIPAIENPDAAFLKIFSFFPLTLPTIMMLRLNISSIPVTEIILTILIMLISIYLTIIISAKIFRIGILSYGRKPSLKELLKWIKE